MNGSCIDEISFLGMSFTGHVALLLSRQRQDSSTKIPLPANKSPAASWLKSSTLATLSLGVEGHERLLTVYIRDQAIIQCSSLLCTLLSPEDSGHGWLLVGSPIWAHRYQVTTHVMMKCRAMLQSSTVACLSFDMAVSDCQIHVLRL